MFSLIKVDYRYIIALSFLFSAVAAVNINMIISVTACLMLLLLYKYYGDRVIIFFIIISLLTITTGLNPALRAIIQVIDTSLLLVLFLFRYGFNIHDYRKIPRNINLFFVIFFALILVSTMFSNYPQTCIPHIVRTILYFIIVYLFYSLFGKIANIKYIVLSLIFVAIIYSTILFYSLLTSGFDLTYMMQEFFGKGENYYAHKNNLGATIAITIPIILAISYMYRVKTRLLLLGVVALLLTGLVLTNSRGAIISLIFGIFFVLYKMNKKHLRNFVIWLPIIFLIIFISPIGNLIELYFRIDSISSGRDWIYKFTSLIIKDNLWIGVGPAATKYEMSKNIPFLIGSPAEIWFEHYLNHNEYGHAHNFYLFMFTDLGIGGFILSLTLPIIFFKNAIITIKQVIENQYLFNLSIGVAGGGIVLFLRGLLEWAGIISYGFILNDLPFWLLFIIIIIPIYNSKNDCGNENE